MGSVTIQTCWTREGLTITVTRWENSCTVDVVTQTVGWPELVTHCCPNRTPPSPDILSLEELTAAFERASQTEVARQGESFTRRVIERLIRARVIAAGHRGEVQPEWDET